MNRETIENTICDIMFYDGPDRHTDGSDVITDFVEALLNGRGEEWAEAYLKAKKRKKETSP